MSAAQQATVPSACGSILTEFLPEEHVARELEIHVKSLRRWHAQKTGPPGRIVVGRKIFYSRSALLKWLEKKQAGGAR